MPKTIQIRNVPDRVHRILKARAVTAGTSLSGYIRKELERTAELPTMEEWLDRVRRHRPIRTDRSAAEIIRELRDSR